MKQVEVFKTSVREITEANAVINFLRKLFSDYSINFDLDDCDHILRIESQNGAVNENEIKRCLNILGHRCELLPD